MVYPRRCLARGARLGWRVMPHSLLPSCPHYYLPSFFSVLGICVGWRKVLYAYAILCLLQS